MTGYVYLYAVMLYTIIIQQHVTIMCTFTWQNTHANVMDYFHTNLLCCYPLCYIVKITIIMKISIKLIIIHNKMGLQISHSLLKLHRYHNDKAWNRYNWIMICSPESTKSTHSPACIDTHLGLFTWLSLPWSFQTWHRQTLPGTILPMHR